MFDRLMAGRHCLLDIFERLFQKNAPKPFGIGAFLVAQKIQAERLATTARQKPQRCFLAAYRQTEGLSYTNACVGHSCHA